MVEKQTLSAENRLIRLLWFQPARNENKISRICSIIGGNFYRFRQMCHYIWSATPLCVAGRSR